MYQAYLKEVYKIYKQIESEYTKYVKTSKNKQVLYHDIAKELHIPMIDIESAIVVIEQNQSSLFKERADDLIGEYIEDLVVAKAKEDMVSINKIQLLLKKELGISTNTINKYSKIVIFQDAVKLNHELAKLIKATKQNRLLTPRTKDCSFTIPKLEEEIEDVQDKLEEPAGEVETNVDEEKNTYSEQSISTKEDNLEVLRKELVCELFKGACCECEEEGFFTRTINKIKSFFSGK